MIYLVPLAGLANRIRCINSGFKLAMESGHDLTIVWRRDKLLNCSFHDLFQSIEQVKVKEEPIRFRFLWTDPEVLKGYNRLLSLFGKMILFHHQVFKKASGERKTIDLSVESFSRISNSHRIYIESSHKLIDFNDVFFIPSDKVQKIASKLGVGIDQQTIGLHIRRTDHVEATNKSSNESFFRVIEKEIKENKKVNFYLATDAAELKILFRKKFGHRVKFSEVELDRNTSEGIKHALAELLCLSRTKKIIGSFKSSFSEMAAKIGNIPIEFA